MEAVAGLLELPAVSPHIAEKSEPPPAPEPTPGNLFEIPKKNPHPGYVDRYGREFDPDLHEEKDGKPVLNRDKFLKLKPGRPRVEASRIFQPQAPAVEVVPPAQVAVEVEQARRQNAETIITIFFASFEQLGESWKPTPGEYKGAVDCTARIMAKYNMRETPPELQLAAIFMLYAGNRLRQPENKPILDALVLWVKQKILQVQALFGKLRRKPGNA